MGGEGPVPERLLLHHIPKKEETIGTRMPTAKGMRRKRVKEKEDSSTNTALGQSALD